jgi:hypothetical protein
MIDLLRRRGPFRPRSTLGRSRPRLLDIAARCHPSGPSALEFDLTVEGRAELVTDPEAATRVRSSAPAGERPPPLRGRTAET